MTGVDFEEIARLRLESMLDELDRSLCSLRAEPVLELTDDERTAALIAVAAGQRTAVLAALKRLRDGRYGRCVDCAHLVPDGRLDARPEAARCVQCQSRLERRR